MNDRAKLYGVMAEFASPEALVDAVGHARAQGYGMLETYSPFSIEGLPEKLGFASNRVPMATLIGGVAGGVGAFFMQWYSAVVDYPINSGGRPLNSWPSFIPATFELTVLGAALAAFLAFILMNGLPRLNHPVFNASDFNLASKSRFFLCIRACDPHFESEASQWFLQGLGAVCVMPVPLDDDP